MFTVTLGEDDIKTSVCVDRSHKHLATRPEYVMCLYFHVFFKSVALSSVMLTYNINRDCIQHLCAFGLTFIQMQGLL